MQEMHQLEQQLDSFDRATRDAALRTLQERARRGEISLPPVGTDVNVHCHSFHSYNAYGYSPSKLAWLGRTSGWAVAGIVDFDTLDGLEEFLTAGKLLGLKACAGIETRVYVPECATWVMNSPGEPGISYHMGVGIPCPVKADERVLLTRLRTISTQRNRELVARVNTHLDPVTLDYDHDVIPLTPSGNVTERYICLAYARKAHTMMSDSALSGFWCSRLHVAPEQLDLPEGVKLQALIRARTMKQGGAGYVQSDRGSFPKLEEMNDFVTRIGGLPTHTWLDGTSEGEQHIEDVLAIEMRTGVVALNIIPDRNYGAAGGDEKLANLYHVVEVAEKLDLILVVGTEMNSPGQKLVDDFQSPELALLAPVFLASAYAIYAHSILQRGSGLGYASAWAQQHFPSRAARKKFYSELGRVIQIPQEELLTNLPASVTPRKVLDRIT